MSNTARPLRLAIVSTPRSGNTWFRNLLLRYYAVPESASHQLTDDDWARMPPEVVHQIHWPRTPEFLTKLRDHGFRVLTLSRHPLDTLISILHFSWYNPETAMWLLGRGGDETGLRGAMPRSRPFIDYATGPRAAALLAVTVEWWQQPDVISVRYEDLVADPAGQLAAIAEHVGPPRCGSVADVVAECSIERLRPLAVDNHYWKGRPGLWRELLPPAEAEEVAAAIAPVLDRLGYVCDPDPRLDARAADYAWVRYVGQELADTVRRNTEGHRAQMAWWEQHAKSAQAAAEHARRERDEAFNEVARLRAEQGHLSVAPARHEA